jgi:hypothetical protein
MCRQPAAISRALKKTSSKADRTDEPNVGTFDLLYSNHPDRADVAIIAPRQRVFSSD